MATGSIKDIKSKLTNYGDASTIDLTFDNRKLLGHMCLNDIGIQSEDTLILSQTVTYHPQPTPLVNNHSLQMQQNDYIQAQNLINTVRSNPAAY